MIAWLAIGLPLVPVLLLRVIPDLGAMAGSSSAALRLGAVQVGLVGFVAFATSLALGARFPAVERVFGGLDRMYRFHRRLGIAVACALAVHLVLMAASTGDITTLLTPDRGWRVFAGVLAFAGLVVLLLLTTLAQLRHETFLRVHRVLGVTFALGALHALRVPAFLGQSVWLNGYLVVVTVVGLVSWGYRSGLGRTLVRRHYYQVAQVRPLHPTITELTLTPLEEPLDFAPGQLVFVGLDDDAVGRELHPFSITSAPGEQTLRLVIKAAGDFTTGLRGVTPTSMCRVEGPYGSFWRDGADATRQVWIAGGIGITPFLSMARSLRDDRHAIDLYYCTMDKETAVLIDELYEVAELHPTLRVIPVPYDSMGFLTADDVRAASGDMTDAHVFLCGPREMIDALVTQLEALGVPPERLHHEDFRLRGRGAVPAGRRP